MVLSLILTVPGEPMRRVQLDRPTLTLGRSSTNDLPLADRTLSRNHALIEQRPGGVFLVDLGSRNGTLLNGSRIVDHAPVKAGDRIQIGETSIELTEDSATRVVIEARGETDLGERTILSTSNALASLRRDTSKTGIGAAELEKLNASLRILNEVSVALLSDRTIGELLTLVLEKVFASLNPDRGLLMLADASGELRPEAVKFAPGVDPSDIRLSRTLVHVVMEEKSGVLMIDTQTDARIGAADSIRLQGITSCLAAPLSVEEKVIGLIYLEARLGRKSFTEDDLRLLSSLANAAAIKIQNARLQEDAVARHRIEREMSLAWDIQRRLLPESAPELERTELFGRTTPSRTVSGDYYDFFERGDGTTDVVVADVSGKGMGASILAASVQAAFQAWASEGFLPGKLCTRLNELIHRKTSPEKFVTLFAAHYDPSSGALTYTNAGHNPGILLRAGREPLLLHAHGTPIGLLPGRQYGSDALALEPGDLLVLYTDGVTEAADPDDEEFGLERLVAAVTPVLLRPLAEVEAAIAAALAAFVRGTPFGDDQTVVLLRRT